MGRRDVGDNLPMFIVFEAGPTHTGLESAKRLAGHAKESGADAVKFQITDHHRLITNRNLLFSYDVLVDKETEKVETVTEPLIDIWERRYMPREDWKALKKYCDEIELDFFATVFANGDVDLVCEMGCDSMKIASQDTNYYDLIKYAAGKGIPVQLDTGGNSLGEVERAVDWIRAQGNEQIIINHCPSGYPARLESINLRMLKTLKRMFPYPVAFSDHTPGWEMDVAAVALGANIVEKTITLDRTTRGCEHMMSLEPPEMAGFVRIIRDVEIALGSNRRLMGGQELKSREKIRRSAYLERDVKAGERFRREDVDFRRPGFGVKPDEYHYFIGMAYGKDLEAGHNIVPDDFQ